MRREDTSRLLEIGVAFDVESHLVQPGLLAPPLVCGSIAFWDPEQGKIVGELLDKETALQVFRQLVEDPERIIILANGSFDVLVCAVEWAKLGVDLMPAIFAKFERGQFYDVLTTEALNAIADGQLGKDPRTGGDLRDPITGETKNRYSLAIVVDLTLDRVDAKINDEWREHYAELQNVPIEEWPPNARHYPVDDARNTFEVALAQCGLIPKRSEHRWHDLNGKTRCERCLVELTFAGPDKGCRVTKPHRNLHALSDQVYTSWCLHLGAAWGFNVDQERVNEIDDEVAVKRKKLAVPLLERGFLEWKKEKGELHLGRRTSVIAGVVARAYGASGRCSSCKGTAKVRSPKSPLVRCKQCRWSGKTPEGQPCLACDSTGKVVSDKHLINCQDCCASGLDLSTAPSLPRTDPSDKFPNGQIQAGRDVLDESGDESLADLADYLRDAKTQETYIPYLRRARVECVGPNGEVYFKSRPLTLKPNNPLETDRVSYDDGIHGFPRKGPLRSCIRARTGYVLASVDWNMGESLTHAQSCRWILGYSDLGDALNKGLDPHALLAAQVLGLTYEEFQARKKEKLLVDTRQGAKPTTFGKPTGMGSPKIVMQARMQGVDTPCPLGPTMIDDGKGNPIPGYRGTRFCILMDGAERCGVLPDGSDNKVTAWGRAGYERECKPMCRACLQCADRIGDHWVKLYRENRPYFKWASDVSENGQPVSQEVADFLGLDGLRLAPGEMLQHVSGIIRGGCKFTDAANGWFQSLLGVAAKLALRWAQRECCDSSYRVPTEVIPGDVASAYAGQRSPLFGSRAIGLMHDELLAELLRSNKHHAATRLSELMVTTLRLICPDQAPAVKAPAALMGRWLKSAEPVVHADELVEWVPGHDEKTCLECEAQRTANQRRAA